METLFVQPKSYSDRMQEFVTDPEIKKMEDKYEPYLEIHEMEDVLEGCDIIQSSPGEAVTGKLIWKSNYDLPLDLKKDIIALYNKHFENE
ncbi:hypothetical protein GS399_13680 [Pedobacter sp. HMF7647]|uniref:Uncharacterized protein n=1 Tax=Hufsiella arboris TaxID=2695275 RepID=A0A7K1YBQ7_9SPHI|nr:hypothetical protein [Hufsiella arboris]MXV52027.1 hypothetical protein [Hufsiella arboris]